MRRIGVLFLAGLIASAVLPGISPGAPARAAESEPAYSWAVDGFPLGPNVSQAVTGQRIELWGDGIVSNGRADGGGRYRIVDSTGQEVAAGSWSARRLLSLQDQGDLGPPVVPFRKGVLVVSASFAGRGAGTVKIYCHREPGDIEGVHVRLGRVRFEGIVQGSTTLAQDGGLYADAVDDGGLPE